MKRRWFSLGVVVVMIGFIIGSTPLRADPPASAPAAPAATQATKTKGMFWKVTSGTTTAYLLGSMHMATPEVYPLSPDIEKAFADANTLVVEIDETKIDRNKMVKLILSEGMYKGDDTLDKHVSPETMKSLTDLCNNLGLPMSGVNKMRPWMLATTLTVLVLQKEGLDPSLGLDKYFETRAKGKEVIELETAEEQIKLLAGFSDKIGERFVSVTVKELDSVKDVLKKLVDAWKTGDEKATEKLLAEDYDTDKDARDFYEALIYDRNKTMADKIEKQLAGDKKLFIVVGAMHLIGDRGVPALLAKKGFTVEKVDLTPPAKTPVKKPSN